MTQIMSVSANTAAFAMEVLKPPQRKGAKTTSEENARTAQLAGAAQDSGAILPAAETITAVSAQLTMLDNGKQNPQATLRQAVEAYLRSGG